MNIKIKSAEFNVPILIKLSQEEIKDALQGYDFLGKTMINSIVKKVTEQCYRELREEITKVDSLQRKIDGLERAYADLRKMMK